MLTMLSASGRAQSIWSVHQKVWSYGSAAACRYGLCPLVFPPQPQLSFRTWVVSADNSGTDWVWA